MEAYQSKRQVTQAATDLMVTIAKTKQKYDITKASKTASDELSRFNRTTGQKKFFTADEVRELGLEDSVNLTDSARVDEEGNAMDRAEIPAYEVYPIALENKLNDVITNSSGGIGWGQGRKDWESQMRLNATKAVESAHIRAKKQIREADLVTRMLDTAESERGGNWPGVYVQINDYPTDANTKRVLTLEAKQREQIQINRDIKRDGDVIEIRAKANKLEAKNYKGVLTNDQRDTEVTDLNSYANSLEKAQVAQAKVAQKARLTAWWANFQDAPDPAMIPDWMEPAERRASLQYAESAGNPKTDRAVWYKLQNLSTSDPEKFADTNLLLHRGELSHSAFEKFAAMQGAIASSAPEATNLRTFGQQVSGALVLAGVDADSKSAEVITRIIADEIALWEADNKRKATFTDRQIIIDEVSIEKPWQDSRKFLWGGLRDSTRKISVAEIPDKELAAIRKKLQDKGMPITTENVRDTYILNKRGG